MRVPPRRDWNEPTPVDRDTRKQLKLNRAKYPRVIYMESVPVCWLVDLDVVPQRADARIVVPEPRLPRPAELGGEYPNLALVEGHCACRLVRERGTVIGLPEAVAAICAHPEVKRVDVLVYWAREKPAAPEEKRMKIGDFVTVCSEGRVEPGVRYRVSPQFTDGSRHDG